MIATSGDMLCIIAPLGDSKEIVDFENCITERALCRNVQMYTDLLPLAYLHPEFAHLPTKVERHLGDVHKAQINLDEASEVLKPFIKNGFVLRYNQIGVWQKVCWRLHEYIPLPDGPRIFIRGSLEIQFAIPGIEICRAVSPLDLSFIHDLTFEKCAKLFEVLEETSSAGCLEEKGSLLNKLQQIGLEPEESSLCMKAFINFTRRTEYLVTLCLLAVGDPSISSAHFERILPS